MSQHAQPVVGAGSAVLVALFLFYCERLEVPLLGALKVSPPLRNHAEVVVGSGLTFCVLSHCPMLPELLVQTLGSREIA